MQAAKIENSKALLMRCGIGCNGREKTRFDGKRVADRGQTSRGPCGRGIDLADNRNTRLGPSLGYLAYPPIISSFNTAIMAEGMFYNVKYGYVEVII